MKVNASGNAALAAVHREFDIPLAARFTGSTDWKLALETRNGFAAWTLESSLRGAAIDLPRPARKTAGETMPLTIERRALANAIGKEPGRDAIVVDSLARAASIAHRKLDVSGAHGGSRAGASRQRRAAAARRPSAQVSWSAGTSMR